MDYDNARFHGIYIAFLLFYADKKANAKINWCSNGKLLTVT